MAQDSLTAIPARDYDVLFHYPIVHKPILALFELEEAGCSRIRRLLEPDLSRTHTISRCHPRPRCTRANQPLRRSTKHLARLRRWPAASQVIYSMLSDTDHP